MIFLDAKKQGESLVLANGSAVPSPAGLPGGGRGIEGIRERAVALGGTAWIGPYQGQFLVDVSLPWG